MEITVEKDDCENLQQVVFSARVTCWSLPKVPDEA